MVDYYNLLGIPRDAPAEAVRRAFRARAKAVHPDAHPHAPPGEREALRRRFILLAQAYETLGDAGRRAAYDRQRPPARTEPRTAAHTGPDGATRGASFGTTPGSAGSAGARRPGPAARCPRSTSGQGPRPAPGPRPGQRAETQGHARADSPADAQGESLEELLQDVEALLGRFGLALRPPFEALLEALLDWAREVFRQVSQAWEGEGAEPGPERTPHAEGAAAGARPHSTRRPAGGARPGAAGSPPAADAAARVQAELAALRARVRQGGMASGPAGPSVEEELRRIKERLGKTR